MRIYQFGCQIIKMFRIIKVPDYGGSTVVKIIPI